jgi:hypothetical protein
LLLSEMPGHIKHLCNLKLYLYNMLITWHLRDFRGNER